MAETVAAGRVRSAGPSRPEGLRIAGALAVLEYCARVYRRNFRGTLFMTFFSPILFLGAIGFGLGSLVNTSAAGAGAAGGAAGVTASGGVLAGFGYAAFLAPGLLVATCMQTGGFEATYPIMGRIVWDKVYHAMLATPISVLDIIAGQISWFALRLSLVATAYFAVMLGFGLIHGGPLAVLVIPIGVLTGLCFAIWIGAFAATQRNDAGFAMIFRFLITPLFLFSGTFFPIERLPVFLQPVAFLTPTYHGVALTRDLALGTAELGPSMIHFAILAAVVVAGIPVCRLTFRRTLVT
jgi:lipooligosaccharide transport system permease protein